MTAAPDDPTVLDTSVLSNFAHVDALDLLVELPRPATVEAVRSELEAGAETHPYLDRALAVLGTDLPVVAPTREARELEADLLETLDPGEAQVLAVAEAAGGTIVTDDGDARSVAKRRGVALTGSIGVLVRSVERGSLPERTADEYLIRSVAIVFPTTPSDRPSRQASTGIVVRPAVTGRNRPYEAVDRRGRIPLARPRLRRLPRRVRWHPGGERNVPDRCDTPLARPPPRVRR